MSNTENLFIHIEPYVFRLPNLNSDDRIIYSRILKMRDLYYHTNISELAYLTRLKKQTIYKHLNKMSNMGLLIKRERVFKGNITRTIYITKYDDDGNERDYDEINKYMDIGEDKMKNFYKRKW